MANKITKKDNINTLINILDYCKMEIEFDFPEGITYETLTEYLNNELTILENKANAAKERAEKKRANGDELRGIVLDAIPYDTAISIDDIVSNINDPNVKRNMVIARLAQLGEGENGTHQIVKENITTTLESGKTRKIAAYRRV